MEACGATGGGLRSRGGLRATGGLRTIIFFSNFTVFDITKEYKKTEIFQRQARHELLRILRNLICDGSIFDTLDKLISPPIFIF